MQQFICPTCGKSFKEKLFFEAHSGLAHDDVTSTRGEESVTEEMPEDIFSIPVLK